MLISATLLLAAGAAVARYVHRRDARGEPPPDEPADARDRAADEPSPEAAYAEMETGDMPLGRYFATAGGGLVMVSAGPALAVPMALSSLPLLGFAAYPAMGHIRDALTTDGKRSVGLVELTCMAGVFASGHLALAALIELSILTTIGLVRLTEDRSARRVFDVYDDLPASALVLGDGEPILTPIREVRVGDIVRVDAGRAVPVDGRVVGGCGRLDEQALTGESRPVERVPGDRVHAATLVLQGRVEVQVERSGPDSVAAQIVETLNQTTDYRLTVRARGEQIVQRGARPTLALGGLALVTLGPAAAVAISLASFGYTLRYAAPIAVLGYLERATRSGALVKDGRALEQLAEVDVVLFDKTGTLTEGALVVEQVAAASGWQARDVVRFAAALERDQTHPIAVAILRRAADDGITLARADALGVTLGSGLRARVGERVVLVGSRRLLGQHGAALPPELATFAEDAGARGSTVVFVAVDGAVIGALELGAPLRDGVAEVIERLHRRGLAVHIVSGDRAAPTRLLARRLGIDGVHAEVPPDGKAEIVRALQATGKTVCFVGDGINDAIALRQADVSISLAGATSIATDSAAIVLMGGELSALPALWSLADEMKANILTSARLSIVPGIFTVGGVFAGAIGIGGAIVMYNVSLGLALLNALRPLRSLGERPADPTPAPDGAEPSERS